MTQYPEEFDRDKAIRVFVKKAAKEVIIDTAKATGKALENPVVKVAAAVAVAPIVPVAALATSAYIISKAYKGEEPFSEVQDFFNEEY